MDRANLYLVLEYVPGGDLGWVCSRSDDNRISEDDARFYASEILIALRYLHTMGIIYRDLKPENLLLGENYDLKIADFGFAAPIEGRDGQGFLYTKLGTLNYMAPEIHLEAPY